MADKSGFLASLRDDPAVKGLFDNAGKFAAARVGGVAEKVAPGASGSAVAGAADAKSEGKSTAFGAIKGAVKGFFGKGGGNKRPTNIYEQIFIGVPVSVAYREWQNYSEFPKFMKGPESVSEQDEDGKTKWTAKIFLNRRSWTATVEEDVENYKIRWSTEAPKGTVDGTVTFHEMGANGCLMVYVLEYRPKGFFEWWGNRWRTVGRRARLDVKHFGRYVMMQDAEEQQDEDEEEPEDEDLSPAKSEQPTEQESDESERAEGTEEPDESGESGESGEPDEREQPVESGDSTEQPEQRRRERTARAPRAERGPRRPRE
jgi:uncharacterized membrane protein